MLLPFSREKSVKLPICSRTLLQDNNIKKAFYYLKNKCQCVANINGITLAGHGSDLSSTLQLHVSQSWHLQQKGGASHIPV